MYKHLEIKNKANGGIDILLDGTPLDGAVDATLNLGVNAIPRLNVTVYVMNASVDLGNVECETYEEEVDKWQRTN